MNTQEEAISGKQILLIFTSVIFVILSAFQSIAQTEKKDLVLIDITDKDYSVLISSLFGKAGKDIDKTSYIYARTIDEYLARIMVKTEKNLLILDTIENQRYFSLNEYYKIEEFNALKERAEENRFIVFSYIENDAFLSESIVYKYDLYPTFLARIINRATYKNKKDKLEKAKREAETLRLEITQFAGDIDN